MSTPHVLFAVLCPAIFARQLAYPLSAASPIEDKLVRFKLVRIEIDQFRDELMDALGGKTRKKCLYLLTRGHEVVAVSPFWKEVATFAVAKAGFAGFSKETNAKASPRLRRRRASPETGKIRRRTPVSKGHKQKKGEVTPR